MTQELYDKIAESENVKRLNRAGLWLVSSPKQVQNGTLAFKYTNSKVADYFMYSTGSINNGPHKFDSYDMTTLEGILDGIDKMYMKRQREVSNHIEKYYDNEEFMPDNIPSIDVEKFKAAGLSFKKTSFGYDLSPFALFDTDGHEINLVLKIEATKAMGVITMKVENNITGSTQRLARTIRECSYVHNRFMLKNGNWNTGFAKFLKEWKEIVKFIEQDTKHFMFFKNQKEAHNKRGLIVSAKYGF